MKKVIAINGSPRKNYNTAALLQEALRGAADAGAETELIHLFDLDYQGCVSCFGCKRTATADAKKCFRTDGLTEVLTKLDDADVLLLGSPIYFFDVTGAVRNLVERLCFPRISYNAGPRTVPAKPMNCGLIFTQNHPADDTFAGTYTAMANAMRVLGGKVEQLVAGETYQFDDYSKYACSRFDEAERRRIRDEEFPKRLAEAYEMGKRLTLGE